MEWSHALDPQADGTTVGGTYNYGFVGTDGGTFSATLPVDGTYTAFVNPNATNTGGATIRVTQTAFFQPFARTISSCDGGGIDFKSACATVSDPVNSLTGAFTASGSDASLPGTGVSFELTRSYDSADLTQYRLGPGWADSFSSFLTVEATGDVVVHSENGQQGLFARQQDGTLVGSAGARSTLSAISGGYELVRHDQVRLRFNTAGRLVSIKDWNDQGLTLVYGTNGKLETVTDSVARVIEFVHNAAGLLSQVTLPDGREVSYFYTSGRLTSVTDLNGGSTTYRYDAAGRLDKITDQSGRVEVENTYGTDGRVSAQLDGVGNNTTFAWNATTQTASVTDARGNVWKDVYANNVSLKRIDALGNETVLSHSIGLDQTSATSPSGAATTMTYAARGNLTEAVAPASRWRARRRRSPTTLRTTRRA